MSRDKITKIDIYTNNSSNPVKSLKDGELEKYCALFWENHHPPVSNGVIKPNLSIDNILALYYGARENLDDPVIVKGQQPLAKKLKRQLGRDPNDRTDLKIGDAEIKQIWSNNIVGEDGPPTYLLKVGISPVDYNKFVSPEDIVTEEGVDLILESGGLII